MTQRRQVFVQSAEGNTVIGNPEQLGGGPADTHLIYEGRTRVETAIADRSWITMVPIDAHSTRETFAHLRRDHGLSRISVIGGRTTASALVDAGLVQGLHLTTSSQNGVHPTSPTRSTSGCA